MLKNMLSGKIGKDGVVSPTKLQKALMVTGTLLVVAGASYAFGRGAGEMLVKLCDQK